MSAGHTVARHAQAAQQRGEVELVGIGREVGDGVARIAGAREAEDVSAGSTRERVGTGSADERKYKRKVTIIQKDRSGAELTRWVIPKAFPAAFETDDWDNESSEHQITKLTLAHEGFEKE